MEGVVSNLASAPPPPRPEKPSPLSAVWQWANKAGAVIADLRTRISALESRPQARDGVSIANIFVDQDNVLVAMMSDGTSLKAGRVTHPVPAIDAASIEDMIAARVEAALAAGSIREPISLAAMQERIDGVYTALAGFRQPKDGESVTVDDVAPLVAAEVERVVGALPKPEYPAPVILPDFDRMISDRVAAAVASIPPALPGKDADLLVVQAMVGDAVAKALRTNEGIIGSVSAEIERLVSDRVAVAVAAIPPAAPGKDVDLLVVQAMVAAEAAKLPRPKDGVTIGDVRPAIDDAVFRAVASAVASLPKPKDGESVTIDDIAPMVRDEVSRAVRDLPAPPEPVDMASIERFVADRVSVAVAMIPPAPAGKDADPVVLQAMVAAEVAKLPRPKDGESVSIGDLLPTIDAAVSRSVTAMPALKDSVTVDDLLPAIDDAVSRAVASLPRPKDGESVAVEDLLPTIDWVVSRAVAALPVPAIDMAAVERFVEDRVTIAVAAIPPALPGKDVDPIVVQAMIAAEVAKLPPPKDGESIDESAIRSMVAEAVAAIPAAKDGESVSEDVVRSMVVDAVNDVVAAWHQPQDGHTPTDEELAPLVESAVHRAVSAIPRANDGVGIADMIVNAEGRLSVVLTDARRLDAGKVVPDAVEGPPGRSIQDANVNSDGVLVVTMSDGTTLDVGRVVGPPGENIKGDAGRGVASLRIVSNDLVVTFTDGEEKTIGRVVGKPGKDGDPGESIKGDKGSSFAFSTSYPASDIDQFRVVEMADDDGNVRRMITLD